MEKNTYLISSILATLLLLSISSNSFARIKCWTNNEGVRECGDTVPPEYSQKGHKEISESGLVVEETERAKTEEEIEEAKKMAAIEAEKIRVEEEKKKHDQILLKTYTNVKDIETSRDANITLLETTITLANKRNEKMQQDLDKRVEQAAAAERGGNSPSEDLLKDIDSLKRQLKDNNDFIEEKRLEQEQVRLEYGKDISRFKALKGIE